MALYFEVSETVDRDKILESVRRICTVGGMELGVIPYFHNVSEREYDYLGIK